MLAIAVSTVMIENPIMIIAIGVMVKLEDNGW